LVAKALQRIAQARPVRLLVLDRTARDLERLLVGLNVAGALIEGWRHQPNWLVVSALALGAYVLIADRMLRRQIGERAWPSLGYARFALNTNLYFALKHLLFGAALFFVASVIARAVG
jgi:hypothetical protein